MRHQRRPVVIISSSRLVWMQNPYGTPVAAQLDSARGTTTMVPVRGRCLDIAGQASVGLPSSSQHGKANQDMHAFHILQVSYN